jgi:protein-S-isoprenylcysteine O-methyltransferase Ste14
MKNGHKIMPTTYFMILLVLSIGSHFLFPIKEILYPPFTYFGFLLIIVGLLLNLWTDWLFKKVNTTVKPFNDPKVLLTSGPFRISRHPMYLGMTSILLGAAIFLGTIITFLFPIIFVILMELLFIPFEEKNLDRIFSLEYSDYKKNVRRWI